ncbi:hypothetical protein ACHAW6_001761 [Cyclotella cf. meneghiniana]
MEYAFGILVHQWGVLRKQMSVNIKVQKISTLVLALCKVHNFCIDNSSEEVGRPSETDIVDSTMDGGLFLPRLDHSSAYFCQCDSENDRLDSLLDGGDHVDNHTRDQRRLYRVERDLPGNRILDTFTEQSVEHPDLSSRRIASHAAEQLGDIN